MKYDLMHKNYNVLTMDIDEKKGKIKKIIEITNTAHLPIGVRFSPKIGIDRNALDEWWIGRSIPASRNGISGVIEKLNYEYGLNITSLNQLVLKGFGLSLSDQYWVKPEGVDLKWENVNFFHNNFTEDMGKLLIGEQGAKLSNASLISPDNTSEGNLKKSWKIIEGDRVLVKAGSGPNEQEPFNEVIASKLMSELGVNHIDYDLYWINDKPFSACKDFVTDNQDLVSAWKVFQIEKQSSNDSSYTHLMKMANKLGVTDFEQKINEMLVVDYLLINEDRHFNNFGFLRDVDTLKIIGCAPIFDSGSSLGYNTNVRSLNENFDPNWKPFKHGKIKSQLDLVTDFSWIDMDKVNKLPKIIKDVFSNSRGYIDETRCDSLINVVAYRINNLKKMVLNNTNHLKKNNNLEIIDIDTVVLMSLGVAKGEDKNVLINKVFKYNMKEFQIKDIEKYSSEHKINAIIEDLSTNTLYLEKNFAGTRPFKLNLSNKLEPNQHLASASSKHVME